MLKNDAYMNRSYKAYIDTVYIIVHFCFKRLSQHS